MQLLAPDLLEAARGLSAPVSAAGVVVGLLLWLSGWRAHRFWIVLASTLTAGVAGLLSPAGRVPPLVQGLLLAVAAGVLALALVRVVAFAAGGAAAWLAVHTFAPPGWDAPLVCFLAGGMVGLLLFRLWTMVLTSALGTLLMAYSGLCLADHLGKVDAVNLTADRTALLNAACAALVIGGVVMQVVLERRRAQKQKQREDRLRAEEALQRLYQQQQRGPWWKRKRGGVRRAG